jgi:hypothetical protein
LPVWDLPYITIKTVEEIRYTVYIAEIIKNYKKVSFILPPPTQNMFWWDARHNQISCFSLDLIDLYMLLWEWPT